MNYTSQSLTDLISFHEIENGVEGETQETSFRITVYTDGIIRVNISPTEDFDFPSYATIAQPTDEIDYSISDNNEYLEISTKCLVLRINKNPVRFNFLTTDRREINAEDTGLGTMLNNGQLTSYRKIQSGERFLGLGEKTGDLDRRGSGYTNWNTDHFGYGQDTDPIYSSIPFYIGIHNQLTYGLFLDNSGKSHFNFGASNNRFASFTVEHGNLDSYLIYGENIPEVIEGYTHLTGRMEMPPLWSLGYQQSRYSYFPEDEVMTLASTFRDKKIPCDTIVLDIHYMENYKIFTWDKQRFPDPKAMIEKLRSEGFEIVVICDPGIKIEKGYEPYEDGLKEDVFIKYPDGANYEARVWPGLCCFPDFTNPKTRTWWRKQFKNYTGLGISGFWNDMNEIASWGNFMPDNMTFDYEGHKTSSLLARNIYGLTMARSTCESAKEHLGNKRHFNLTRAAFAGIQRYSAKWTGDNSASDDHMILGVMLQNSLGLSGVSFTGNDIGGFQKDATPELFARWIALGAFSPFFRCHSLVNTRDSEPWSYGEWIEDISRNYINLRYQLLPYLYSLFYQSTRTGIPVVRSLAIDHPFEDQVYRKEFQAQYFLGPFILIAPVRSQQNILKIWLPEGNWFDLLTGRMYDGDQTVYMDTPVHKLPILIKAPSVLPMHRLIQTTKEDPGPELLLHIYFGKGKTSFEYYEDDGSTYDYREGEYYLRRIEFNEEERSLLLKEPSGSFTSKFTEMRIVLHGFNSSHFMINGKHLHTETGTWKFMESIIAYDPLESALSEKSEEVLIARFPFEDNRMELTWD